MTEPASAPQRRRPRGWVRVLVWLAVIYAAYCAGAYFMQTQLLFPADLAGLPLPQGPPQNAQTLTLQTDEGPVVAWLVLAPGASAEAPAPLAVFFHGNAELIDHQREVIGLYHRLGVSVLLPEYRGYGRSAGMPSEAAIVADAVALLDRALADPAVDASRVVLHGRSLGGGVAAQVAARRPPGALVLESAGLSITSMAWRRGVPGLLVRHPFRTDRVLPGLDAPVLILHGGRDAVFPVSHARRLAELARDAELIVFDADHFLQPTDPELVGAVQAHLQRSGIMSNH